MVSDVPEKLSVIDNRLHCEKDMAIRYPDGWGLWAWKGVVTEERIIKCQFQVKEIDQEKNQEIRRVMVEVYEAKYGRGAYMRDTGAKPVHTDDWGSLYRKQIGGLVMNVVEVVNATPEPDGTFKNYWLQVPPEIETAHAAVA